ncbi:hypothetical protein FRZ03_28040 [Streptomyces misionensis]|uniref:Uncharacterized protein n=1 Tax=Streptomyces misionensis TaxID=67331 RepID=A0A5C6J2I5_9ACTN|nr:hypothetical protein FRZ03_28040 [Streptomyces misionensis]
MHGVQASGVAVDDFRRVVHQAELAQGLTERCSKAVQAWDRWIQLVPMPPGCDLRCGLVGDGPAVLQDLHVLGELLVLRGSLEGRHGRVQLVGYGFLADPVHERVEHPVVGVRIPHDRASQVQHVRQCEGFLPLVQVVAVPVRHGFHDHVDHFGHHHESLVD